MIYALRYEPQDQRQRFEPQEQQSGEQQEQDGHIHLHFHLNLTFRARQRRSTPPNAIRFTRIFAALVGATVIPLWLFGAIAQEGGMSTTLSILAGIFLAGLALAWGFGCLPLLVSAWRASPRVGFLLLVLLLIIPFSLWPGLWLFAIMRLLGILWIGPGLPLLLLLLLLLLYVHPLISALLLACVSREVRALRQTATAHSRLSLVIVSGMALMLLGGLLLNLFVMLSTPLVSPAPPFSALLFLPAMCAAVIVAIRTLFGLSHSCESTRARPKDASPSDVDSSGEPRGYRD